MVVGWIGPSPRVEDSPPHSTEIYHARTSKYVVEMYIVQGGIDLPPRIIFPRACWGTLILWASLSGESHTVCFAPHHLLWSDSPLWGADSLLVVVQQYKWRSNKTRKFIPLARHLG